MDTTNNTAFCCFTQVYQPMGEVTTDDRQQDYEMRNMRLEQEKVPKDGRVHNDDDNDCCCYYYYFA